MNAGNIFSGKAQGVSLWTGVALFVNFTIGSGFLMVPWAFYESGPILSFFVTSIIICLQWVSNRQTLEAHARANALDERIKSALLNEEDLDQLIEETTQFNTVETGSERPTGQPNDQQGPDHEPYMVTHQINLPVLIGLFLGQNHMTAYTIQFALANFMTLWVWVAVFATSWATYVPFGGMSYEGSYLLYCFIVMCIQTPCGMLSLEDQAEVQVLMFCARLLIFFLCFFTVIVAWTADINAFDLGSENASYTPQDDGMWRMSNMYVVMTVMTFCSLNNYALPPLVGSVASKADLSTIILVVGIISFIIYSGFGLILGIYFGDNVETPVSTLWENFTGFSDSSGTTPLYAQIIAGYVVIFPSLDVMSAYAMVVAIACDNTLYLALGPDKTNALMRENKPVYFTLRGLSAALPAAGAMAASDLGYLTVVGGLLCFTLQFIYSPLLSRYSKDVLAKLGKPVETVYTLELDEDISFWMVSVGCAVLLYLIISFIVEGVPSELK